jgi:hypothetical protein
MKKTVFVCAVLFNTVAADAAMFRVIQVLSSRAMRIDSAGKVEQVILRDVQIAAEDEKVAAGYLRKAVENRWVYIENGDVYRSPDGLFINDAMRRRVWRGMTILGELPPLPRQAAPKSTPRKRDKRTRSR